MSRFDEVEDIIYKYLSYNNLTVEKYVDGRYYKQTQRKTAIELSAKITPFLLECERDAMETYEMFADSRKRGEEYGI